MRRAAWALAATAALTSAGNGLGQEWENDDCLACHLDPDAGTCANCHGARTVLAAGDCESPSFPLRVALCRGGMGSSHDGLCWRQRRRCAVARARCGEHGTIKDRPPTPLLRQQAKLIGDPVIPVGVTTFLAIVATLLAHALG